MKKVIIIVISVLLAAGIAVVATLGGFGYYSYSAISETVTAPTVSTDGSIVIMSANIRRKEKWYSTAAADTGSHRWYKRAKGYLANIAKVAPDIFGAQEVQKVQYEFLKEHLTGYGSVVTYRDDRGARSESCPIFYSENRFTLADSGTFWLSDTPTVMSRFPEAEENDVEHRIVTYVVLLDKADNNKRIAVFNLHPESADRPLRDKQLKVVAEQVQTITADEVIVLGDFNIDNTNPNETNGLAPIEAFLKDSATFEGMSAYAETFHGYDLEPGEHLDYIFLSPDAHVEAVERVTDTYDGVYPSDHYPIYAKVNFKEAV